MKPQRADSFFSTLTYLNCKCLRSFSTWKTEFFSRSTSGLFGWCSSKTKITGSSSSKTRELFVLIKKLCVNGIQKPTTEFQFHFMFIFPLWVESPTCENQSQFQSKSWTKVKWETMNNVVCIRWMSYVCSPVHILHTTLMRWRWNTGLSFYTHIHANKSKITARRPNQFKV